VPAVIGVIIGIALYGAACYFAFVWIVAPVWPFMVVGGIVLGVLAVVVVVAATLLGFGRLGAPTVTPADVPARLRKIRSEFPRDDAWPLYLFGQASTDLRTALGHCGDVLAVMWVWLVTAVRDQPVSLAFWPLLLLPFTAAATGTAAAVAAVLVLGAVLTAVLLLSWLGWLVAAGALRGADHGLRLLRRAKATCGDPKCTHRSRLPAYRCSCGRLHHDIRAGRQGLFVRRCACGSRVPTTVLKAAAGLVAVCQDCGRDLHGGAGALTDVVIPVFGSTSAGKTRLIYAGMVALSRHLPAAGGTFTPDGVDSEAVFREATTVVERGTETTKTPAERPTGIHARVQPGGGREALMHLFDAAGEGFTTRDAAADLRFLDDPEGLVFVLDPFSMPAVASSLHGALAPRLTAAHPAQLDPEQSYLVTASWLRDQGVRLARKPLAVAVVKADLLLGLPPADGLRPTSTSDDIEGWLRTKGMDNLLDGMSRDFREVCYHLVASRDAGTGRDGAAGPTSAARPLLWLLGRTGVAIADPQPVGAT
jgi:Double-GTPase 2